MIYLRTGKPGAGKTLHTIGEVLKRSQQESRPVHYCNIDGLTLEWKLIDDPKKWYEVEQGAILLIDECSLIFPPLVNKVGTKKPDHYSQFAEHRHLGHDIYLLSQHENDFDIFIRRKAENHFHYKPKSKTQSSLLEFDGCRGISDEDTKFNKPISRRLVKHDKNLYSVYKSASIHYVKRSWSKKLLIIPFLFITLFFAIYLVYDTFTTMGDDDIDADPLTNIVFNQDIKSTFPDPIKALSGDRSKRHRSYDYLEEGLLANRNIYIIGQYNDTYFFEVDKVTFSSDDLREFGYTVSIKNICIGFIKLEKRHLVTCKPYLDAPNKRTQRNKKEGRGKAKSREARAAPFDLSA